MKTIFAYIFLILLFFISCKIPEDISDDNNENNLEIKENLLKNGSFNNDLDNWGLGLNNDGDATFDVVDQAVKITIFNGGDNRYDICFNQGNINIEKGCGYTIQFDAKALTDMNIYTVLLLNNAPWTEYANKEFTISTEWNTYTGNLNMLHDSDPITGFQIHVGGNDLTGEIYFDNISLTKNDNYNAVEIDVNGLNEINTISDEFFGQNYWMWPPSWGSYIDGTESLISDLNIKFLRYGGIPCDLYEPDPVTLTELTKFYNYCGAIGAEPYLQVPLAKFTNTDERRTGAIEFLDMYSAINSPYYVALGNEPDIYHSELYQHYNITYLENYSVYDYINDFKAVSTEIRANYPDVKIIGMDICMKYDEWIPPFVSECWEYVDIIATHYYPYSTADCTHENVSASYDSIINYFNNIRTKIDDNAHGKEIPLIISETNVAWEGVPVSSDLEATLGTFYGGLWMADFIGISSSQQNLLSIMPWCIADDWKLGFLHAPDPSNPDYKEIKPVYYIYKMFSNFIKPELIHIEKINDDLRIYTYKDDADNTAIFAVNWSKEIKYGTKMNFSNILSDETISYTFKPSSLTCLSISADLTEKKAYVYTKGNADGDTEYTENIF